MSTGYATRTLAKYVVPRERICGPDSHAVEARANRQPSPYEQDLYAKRPPTSRNDASERTAALPSHIYCLSPVVLVRFTLNALPHLSTAIFARSLQEIPLLSHCASTPYTAFALG
jgi:hypothetical protein